MRKRLSYTPIYHATCQFTRGSMAEDGHKDGREDGREDGHEDGHER